MPDQPHTALTTSIDPHFGQLLEAPARRGRPAEALAGAGSIGLLIAYVLGVQSPEQVAVIGAAVGLIPALVTTLVEVGGIRGLLSRIWRGH